MDSDNTFIDLIRNCDKADLRDWIERFLANVNYSDCRWFPVSDENGELYLTASDNTDGGECLIAVRQYSILTVDIEELTRFVGMLKGKNFRNGMFITTSAFSKECKAYVDNVKNECGVAVALVDGRVMSRYIKHADILGVTDLKDDERLSVKFQKTANASRRLRGEKKLLRVTFKDGTVLCDKNASQTFLQTIKHIGADLVAGLGLEVCHIPLVSRNVNEKYKEWIKPIGDGWYVMIQSDTEQKVRQLYSINNQLSLNMIIDLGYGWATSSTTEKRSKHKVKTQLLVTLPDGKMIAGSNATETFVEFVKYIGVDRIEKKNIQMANKQLFTHTNKYIGQIEIENGKWLTIPNNTKGKYKIMKVIGSMVHTDVEITII